jgi:hypothetical protein
MFIKLHVSTYPRFTFGLYNLLSNGFTFLPQNVLQTSHEPQDDLKSKQVAVYNK